VSVASEAAPEVSVVIPTVGSRETLARVLDGFAGQSAAVDRFEVIVVVDPAEDSPDMVDQAIGTRDFEVRRVQGLVPGASGNRNLGVEAARAGLILFTDDDTIPAPNLVAEHLRWHELYRERTVGVLGLIRWAPELEVTTFMRWLDTGIQFDFSRIEGIEAGWGRFYTANVSVKADFFREVGGFDQERLPYGCEDTDWASRANERGFRLLFNCEAMVDHLRPTTLEIWKEQVRRIAIAEHRYSQLHPDQTPWFYSLFSGAMRRPPASGRGIPLEPYVPAWVPGLGKRVRDSVDIYYRQALAPHFLDAWRQVADERSVTQAD
jgi:GT2 family glycosyltransferase